MSKRGTLAILLGIALTGSAAGAWGKDVEERLDERGDRINDRLDHRGERRANRCGQ